MRRVVITGTGTITPIGNDKDTFWKNIKEGVCGVDLVTRFDTTEFACRIGAEVKDFNPEDYLDKKEAKRMDRYTQYAMAAAKMAVEDSKLDMEKEDATRVGVIVASGVGGMETLENQANALANKGPGRVSPFFIPMMISNMAAGQVAIKTGAKGVNYGVVSACASSSNAIGDAFRLIAAGDADVIIAGGAEAAITPLSYAGFCSMKALATNNEEPKKASCPFTKSRSGFVMGEGAGSLIMESLEHAKARGANIIAEIVGYGATDDAHHVTAPAPDGEGGARAMALAVKNAGIDPSEVSYINAHGTSTEYNDKYETAAIKTVFGDSAYNIPVSSTKSMTGHLLGAAGAVEAIVCVLAIRDSFIPATINYDEKDPECDLDYVPNEGRNKEVRYALSNSLGFGGHNASLLFKKYED